LLMPCIHCSREISFAHVIDGMSKNKKAAFLFPSSLSDLRLDQEAN